jgi:hypothetical protein
MAGKAFDNVAIGAKDGPLATRLPPEFFDATSQPNY